MKLALTGSSSTGKTTLAMSLLQQSDLHGVINEFCTTDARSLLTAMGHRSMDMMSREELRTFEITYFERKKQLEAVHDKFITDRSFVDIAAYWLERDTFDRSTEEQEFLILRSKEESKKYDLHIYLPFGLLPFESDGYRSNDIEFHKKIDQRIREFLDEWNLNYIQLDTIDQSRRIKEVLERIKYFFI